MTPCGTALAAVDEGPDGDVTCDLIGVASTLDERRTAAADAAVWEVDGRAVAITGWAFTLGRAAGFAGAGFEAGMLEDTEFFDLADELSAFADGADVDPSPFPPPTTEAYTDLTNFADDLKKPNRLVRPFGLAGKNDEAGDQIR